MLSACLLLLCPRVLPAANPLPSASKAQIESAFYRVETVPVPQHIILEVGGLAFMADGRLMIGTRRGEIWSRRGWEWKRFASGLDEVMGIWPTAPNQIVISQRPEFTRLTDTDGDGEADVFETITDAWNYTGHMYEWTFGPVQDAEGNLWGTLACWFFPTNVYQKNPYSGWEIPPPAGYKLKGDAVWRGWCFKISQSGQFIPWSCGLRSPNGLGFNLAGDLFVTENQGEYFGACVLHHVTRGAFHGHPNGLFWDKPAPADPFAVPMEELAERRKVPAVYFPYGVMGQSASQPLWDTTNGKFGPFAGQMFVGDQTISTLMRVSLEKVDGEYQGACFPFRAGFQCGNNRLVFAPDGTLLVGQTDRGWGATGGKPFGLQRVVWTGEMPFEIQNVRLTRSGFDLIFTKAVDASIASRPETYSLQYYHYHYHRTYGSPQVGITPARIGQARVCSDGKTVSVGVQDLKANEIYEFNLAGLKALDGSALVHPTAYYTLNRLQK